MTSKKKMQISEENGLVPQLPNSLDYKPAPLIWLKKG